MIPKDIPTTLESAIQKSQTVEEFIEALDHIIPHCHPRVTDSERQIWINVGKRELVSILVQQLKELYEEQP